MNQAVNDRFFSNTLRDCLEEDDTFAEPLACLLPQNNII
jgi:hypothetical protein